MTTTLQWRMERSSALHHPGTHDPQLLGILSYPILMYVALVLHIFLDCSYPAFIHSIRTFISAAPLPQLRFIGVPSGSRRELHGSNVIRNC